MKQTLIKTILIALLPILWVACGNDDNNPDINNGGGLKIAIDAKNNEISGNGGGLFLRIETNSEWTASVQDSWCTLQRSSGKGTSSVMCAVAANTGKQRSTIITVNSGKEVQEITLTQKEGNGETPDPGPDPDPDPDPDRPSRYAGRIEIPKLLGGSMNLFRTHTTTENGKEVIAYSYEYDCTKYHSRWVALTFSTATPNKNVGRNDNFTEDPLLPKQYQLGEKAYSGSGYSRGHLAASSDRQYSVTANKKTFYMSNMSPQIQNGFNGGIWLNLERRVQELGTITNSKDTLYVAKGGTIKENQIKEYISDGSHRIAVPNHFFMALLSLKNGTYKAIGFWFDHKSYSSTSKFSDCAVSIDDLEQKTGIDFFHNLSDDIENEIERTYNKNDWGI